MKKALVTIGVYLISMILVSMNQTTKSTGKELPSVLCNEAFVDELTSFIEFGNHFHESIETAPRAAVIAKFLQLRMKFEEIEFVVAYVNPGMFNNEINGASLSELLKEINDLKVIEPRGLRRIEEIVYTDNFDRGELLYSFEKFQLSIQQFAMSFEKRGLSNVQVFESIDA